MNREQNLIKKIIQSMPSKVIGVTGSIGSGKSAVSRILREYSFEVLDADQIVHHILDNDLEVIEWIGKTFDCLDAKGKVERKQLAQIIFSDNQRRKILESRLHPIVYKEIEEKLYEAKLIHKQVILDVPLLFETGGEKYCDYTILVATSQSLQWSRVSLRKDMDKELFDKICQSQMSVSEKRKRANYYIQSGLDFRELREQIDAILWDMYGDE